MRHVYFILCTGADIVSNECAQPGAHLDGLLAQPLFNTTFSKNSVKVSQLANSFKICLTLLSQKKMISNLFHSTYFDFPWVFEISLAEPYKEQKAQTGKNY